MTKYLCVHISCIFLSVRRKRYVYFSDSIEICQVVAGTGTSALGYMRQLHNSHNRTRRIYDSFTPQLAILYQVFFFFSM